MDVFDRSLEKLRNRQQRVKEGKINCIPLVFPRLRNWLPGIEKKRYSIITASQKVGKSKLCDYMLLYEPFFYMINHPDIVKLKIIYFTLEMGKEEKFFEFLCFLLYKLDSIRISPTDLKSTNAEKPVSDHILNLLESERYLFYINKFKEIVTYVDDIRHPTGINKYCTNFANSRGTVHYKEGKYKDELTGEFVTTKQFDYFVPDDPEEYWLVILDNYSNLQIEHGDTKLQTIEKMSKYNIILRDKYEFNITAIQHQAQAQEGIDNFKLNKIKPSADGLADCKTTSRDCNLLLGLYSPFKYGFKDYEGYDITKFRNYIRFLEVLEDRDNGASGQVCPLFFDGAISTFRELPLPKNTIELEPIYNYVNSLDRKTIADTTKLFISFTLNKTKNFFKLWQKL